MPFNVKPVGEFGISKEKNCIKQLVLRDIVFVLESGVLHMSRFDQLARLAEIISNEIVLTQHALAKRFQLALLLRRIQLDQNSSEIVKTISVAVKLAIFFNAIQYFKIAVLPYQPFKFGVHPVQQILIP